MATAECEVVDLSGGRLVLEDVDWRELSRLYPFWRGRGDVARGLALQGLHHGVDFCVVDYRGDRTEDVLQRYLLNIDGARLDGSVEHRGDDLIFRGNLQLR